MICFQTKSCSGPKSGGRILGALVEKRSRRHTPCLARIRSQRKRSIAIDSASRFCSGTATREPTDSMSSIPAASSKLRSLQPELDAGLRLRHATDADLEARVDVHRDAWSVWGRSKTTVETYRRLRSAPLYDPELDVVLEDAARQISQLLHRMAGHRERASDISSRSDVVPIHRTRIRSGRDY